MVVVVNGVQEFAVNTFCLNIILIVLIRMAGVPWVSSVVDMAGTNFNTANALGVATKFPYSRRLYLHYKGHGQESLVTPT
jgi:hypothetical protein